MRAPRKRTLALLSLALPAALIVEHGAALARRAPRGQSRPTAQTAGSPTAPAPKATAPAAKEPDYSKEAFVVEQLKTSYRFEHDGTGRREMTFRAKVQSDAALQSFGELYFPYLSDNERVEIDYVRARKPDGSTVAANAASAQDMTAPVAREAPVYTDLRLKQVSVPGLRPGDRLEYHVVWQVHTPLAPNQFWLEHEFVNGDFVVLDEQLEVDIPADSAVKLKCAPGLDPATREQGGRRIYTWKHANLKREEETDEAKKKKKDDSEEPKPPQVQLTTFRSWAEVGQWYADLQRDRVLPDERVRAKAAELVRGRATDLEKVEALYDYVAKNFRYVSLSLGQARYQPHPAGEVFANQYGDCKDKHTLLASMLAAAGLRAYPALIPSSRKLDPEMPSPAPLDHVITAVPLGQETVWLDTTTEVAPFRLLAEPLRDKQALVVPADAPARLEKTPADPPFPSSETVEIDGRVNELGKLTAHARVTARGDQELLLRVMFRRTPPGEWDQLGDVLAMRSGIFADVTGVKPADPAATGKPFQLEYDFSINEFVRWSGKKAKVSLPLPDFELPSADADRQPDSPPIKLGAPTEIAYRAKLALPAGFEASAPLPVALARDYAEYRSAYKVEGSTVTAERVLRLRARELPAARAQDYAAFVASERADSNQPLSLENARAAGAPAIPASMKADELIEAAQAAESSGDYPLVEQLLRRALEKEPKHKTARRNLAYALFAQHKDDEAARVLREQTAINPFDDYAYQLLGEVFWREQKYAEAEAALRKQLEVTPLSKAAQSDLARMLVESRKYKEAVPELEKAISLDPDEEFLHVSLGTAYVNLGRPDKALAAFDRAVKLAPGAPVWNDVAYALALGKLQLDRAQQYAESAVTAVTTELRNAELERLTSEDLANVNSLTAYWDTLGWVAYQKGDVDLAERYVNAAWLVGQYGENGYHVGQILEKRGKPDEAARAYAMAAVAFQPVPDSRESLVRLVGKERAEAMIKKAGEELDALRAVTLAQPVKGVKEKAEADFFLLVVPGASRAAKVAGVKFAGGSDELRPLAAALKSAELRFSFPDETPTKLILRGHLACAPQGGCTFTLMRPIDVTSPE